MTSSDLSNMNHQAYLVSWRQLWRRNRGTIIWPHNSLC